MNIELIKAIFAAGFNLGHQYGQDSATAWEWGCRSDKPQNWQEVWEHDIQWRLDTIESSFKMDLAKIEDWENI